MLSHPIVSSLTLQTCFAWGDSRCQSTPRLQLSWGCVWREERLMEDLGEHVQGLVERLLKNHSGCDMWWYGYGSIPIVIHFSGMNIHKSQLFYGVHIRYQGFDPSPYVVIMWCAGLPQLRCAPSLAVHMEIETSKQCGKRVLTGIELGQHGRKARYFEIFEIGQAFNHIQSSSTCTRIRCRHWIHHHFLKGTLRIPLHLDISCCPERSCAHLKQVPISYPISYHQLSSAPHGPTLPHGLPLPKILRPPQ